MAARPAVPALSTPQEAADPQPNDGRSPPTGSCFIPASRGQLGCSLKEPPGWTAGSREASAWGGGQGLRVGC